MLAAKNINSIPLRKEDKALSNILTYQQYSHLKNELDLNRRDRLILTFAWELLLSNEEMRDIKIKDIEFGVDDFTKLEVVWINLGNRKIKIEDSEMVYDIRRCMRDISYRILTADNKDKNIYFKDSEYLLKPLRTNAKYKDEDYLISPSTVLKNTIIQQNIKCPEYDIYNINVENIRKSKFVYMLAPQNRPYFDEIYISDLLETCDMSHNFQWYKKLAEKKYGSSFRKGRN